MVTIPRKHLLMSMIGLVPFLGYIVFVFRGSLSILGVIFVVPSCFVLAIIILGFCFLHNKRTKNKTGPKNISLYLSYVCISALIIYFGIMAPYDMTFIRPGSQFAMLAFVFFPFYAGIAMVIGYLLGWPIEIVLRIGNETYRAEDALGRKAFHAHFSKHKNIYLVISIVIVSYISLTGGAKLLESAGINPWSDIHYAAQVGSIRQVQKFLDKGIDINARDQYGKTPLCVASEFGKKSVVDFLLAEGAQTDIMNSWGEYPLHAAAKRGGIEVVESLIRNGDNVNLRTTSGDTPLHMAVHKNQIDVALFLLSHGAEINNVNKNNQTPLWKAVYWAYDDLSKMFIQHGADVNISDKWGRSPLSVAVEKKYKGIEKLLREHGAKE